MKIIKISIVDIFSQLFRRDNHRARRIENLANKITRLPVDEAMILFLAIQKAATKMGMTK